MSEQEAVKAEDMAATLVEDPERLSPERRQNLAVASLAAPILAQRGFKMGRKWRDTLDVADAVATLEGQPNRQMWANEVFNPRGVRRAK